MGTWVLEYMSIWVLGYMGIWVFGYQGIMGIWVFGYQSIMGIMGIWVLGIWVYVYYMYLGIWVYNNKNNNNNFLWQKNYLQVEVLQVLYNNVRPIGSKGLQARYNLSSKVVKRTINQYRKQYIYKYIKSLSDRWYEIINQSV